MATAATMRQLRLAARITSSEIVAAGEGGVPADDRPSDCGPGSLSERFCETREGSVDVRSASPTKRGLVPPSG